MNDQGDGRPDRLGLCSECHQVNVCRRQTQRHGVDVGQCAVCGSTDVVSVCRWFDWESVLAAGGHGGPDSHQERKRRIMEPES